MFSTLPISKSVQNLAGGTPLVCYGKRGCYKQRTFLLIEIRFSEKRKNGSVFSGANFDPSTIHH